MKKETIKELQEIIIQQQQLIQKLKMKNKELTQILSLKNLKLTPTKRTGEPILPILPKF